MLFNSYVFIFAFLPLTLAGFFILGRYKPLLAAAWLTAASLVFYGWWNPVYVWLLAPSVCFNYACGMTIVRAGLRGDRRMQKRMLIFAVTANIAVLGYYKYANFFLASINHVSGAGLTFGEIVLPLGISFFTFTQIAFLADAYYGKAREYNFVHYGLFVTYFPHLIAGPVLHHSEMMPQFGQPATYRFSFENAAVGITIFVIGLFKKVMLADNVGAYAKPVFDAAAAGVELTLLEAWCGALAYTFQLYFDFSGYSDMAIGLSRLFGVVLPLNFHSPYKAVNIIDFWRRWHMTLSRFLRDYLYIPLGGNRKGAARRYLNLMITMALGGLWHGAGWTFVAWGTLHGVYLAVNHGWRTLRGRLGQDLKRSTWWGRACACLLTFIAVVIGWVFFRAADFTAAVAMLKAMAGLNGVVSTPILRSVYSFAIEMHWPFRLSRARMYIGVGWLFCVTLPAEIRYGIGVRICAPSIPLAAPPRTRLSRVAAHDACFSTATSGMPYLAKMPFSLAMISGAASVSAM